MATESKVQDRDQINANVGHADFEAGQFAGTLTSGWVCPVCSKIYSPQTKSCPSCVPAKPKDTRQLLNE